MKTPINSTLKYRNEKYDKYDTLYASTLKTIFNLHTSLSQAKFNEFTDNLMNENQISRFKLLDAIGDYNCSGYAKMYPLHTLFEDGAFNYRPYQ